MLDTLKLVKLALRINNQDLLSDRVHVHRSLCRDSSAAELQSGLCVRDHGCAHRLSGCPYCYGELQLPQPLTSIPASQQPVPSSRNAMNFNISLASVEICMALQIDLSFHTLRGGM